MMVMLGFACCRASSSQLAKWLKVSRLWEQQQQHAAMDQTSGKEWCERSFSTLEIEVGP
jgi:hypothetical protein